MQGLNLCSRLLVIPDYLPFQLLLFDMELVFSVCLIGFYGFMWVLLVATDTSAASSTKLVFLCEGILNSA